MSGSLFLRHSVFGTLSVMYFSVELEQILMRCCRMFSFGEFKADDQEKMLSVLNKKVEEVYRSCIGDNEANIRYM